MRLKKSRVIPLHPTRSLYGSYSVNFIIVIIIIAYMRALFQNGAQKDRGSHDPLHLCYKTALFSHNRLQLHHTTCCSPRYKWSSTGSSSTSNSLTMLGWCSFFSIAISLYTLSRGFTDDLILLGAARPATTQWWSLSVTFSVCICSVWIHLSCYYNFWGYQNSDDEETGLQRRYVQLGGK